MRRNSWGAHPKKSKKPSTTGRAIKWVICDNVTVMRREKELVKEGKEVKKTSEMTKGQIKYETKRAVKNGMTLEEWIEFKNTVPEVTLYHYTNGVKLPYILKDGFLDLEAEHNEDWVGKNPYFGCENYLWMTSEGYTPSCTLPCSVNAKGQHTGNRPEIGNGYYRFSFKLSDFETIELFNNSKLFQQLKNRKYGVGKLYDEFVSNAGADTNCWYVSKKQLPISLMKIEKLVEAEWTNEKYLGRTDNVRIKTEGKWVDCTHLVTTNIASNDNDNLKAVA